MESFGGVVLWRCRVLGWRVFGVECLGGMSLEVCSFGGVESMLCFLEFL